jgi:hypothetical protein
MRVGFDGRLPEISVSLGCKGVLSIYSFKSKLIDIKVCRWSPLCSQVE